MIRMSRRILVHWTSLHVVLGPTRPFVSPAETGNMSFVIMVLVAYRSIADTCSGEHNTMQVKVHLYYQHFASSASQKLLLVGLLLIHQAATFSKIGTMCMVQCDHNRSCSTCTTKQANPVAHST